MNLNQCFCNKLCASECHGTWELELISINSKNSEKDISENWPVTRNFGAKIHTCIRIELEKNTEKKGLPNNDFSM